MVLPGSYCVIFISNANGMPSNSTSLENAIHTRAIIVDVLESERN